jgi:hypothetical protein
MTASRAFGPSHTCLVWRDYLDQSGPVSLEYVRGTDVKTAFGETAQHAAGGAADDVPYDAHRRRRRRRDGGAARPLEGERLFAEEE